MRLSPRTVRNLGLTATVPLSQIIVSVLKDLASVIRGEGCLKCLPLSRNEIPLYDWN